MCLITISWKTHRPWRLVVAANRDELRERPTAPADFWRENSSILAGRDLSAGGSWMGISTNGSFAAITNFREMAEPKPDAPSRGGLVRAFLESGGPADAFLAGVVHEKSRYAGFNLFVCDGEKLCYFSNRSESIETLPPGIYGLSNHLLDTPWPKVRRAKAGLRAILDEGEEEKLFPDLFDLLADHTRADDAELPDTGVGLERERDLSPIFIRGSFYGTRSSTVVGIRENGEMHIAEHTFHPDGSIDTEREYLLKASRIVDRGSWI
ncbi:MAG: NRDE family protein [Thermoanaerobaculia bacterium]